MPYLGSVTLAGGAGFRQFAKPAGIREANLSVDGRGLESRPSAE
jgi:hypothetical protein